MLPVFCAVHHFLYVTRFKENWQNSSSASFEVGVILDRYELGWKVGTSFYCRPTVPNL